MIEFLIVFTLAILGIYKDSQQIDFWEKDYD